MSAPLVSVVIPSYNAAGWTVEAVESLLCQTYPAVEVVVVDDGSRDDSVARLAPYAAAGRIVLIPQSNRGTCAARNAGLRACHGEFVGFLDCDDTYLPTKIEKVVSFFASDPECGLVFTSEYLTDADNRPIGINRVRRFSRRTFLDRLRVKNIVGSSTPIMRRSVLEAVGAWDESIFPQADWELWLRIAERATVDYIDEPLSRSRQASRFNQRNLGILDWETRYVIEKRIGPPGSRAHRVALAHHHYLVGIYLFEAGERASADEAFAQAVGLHRSARFLLGRYVLYRFQAVHALRRRLSLARVV